ncbi:MAG: MBL fold metallo-hydrolase [Candidatus Bathyarchaeota archaeon]|nr:MBL fold metallo-hydrolase [Candidatus Bathyarchaeota archaeon]
MEIQTFIVGILSTNCYVVSCSDTKEAMIIDPGFDSSNEAGQIIHYIDEKALKTKFIINTHGHQDHISGDLVLRRKYNVPICIHAYDAPCLKGLYKSSSPANVLVGDGQVLKIGNVTLKVIHTPGHTPGGISLVGKKLVFSGDTLFAGGIGRTNLAGGSDNDMRRSLQKISGLPDNFVVYPGHGGFSTINEEKRFNPFLQWL